MMSDWTARDMAKSADFTSPHQGVESGTPWGAGHDINPKEIVGSSKPQLHLIPSCAEVAIARVMETGAAKYGPYNWRHKPIRYTPYINAARRHLLAFADGEINDPESGQPHLAHAASTIMILLDAIQNASAVDDRVKAGEAGMMINPIETRGKVVVADPYAKERASIKYRDVATGGVMTVPLGRT